MRKWHRAHPPFQFQVRFCRSNVMTIRINSRKINPHAHFACAKGRFSLTFEDRFNIMPQFELSHAHTIAAGSPPACTSGSLSFGKESKHENPSQEATWYPSGYTPHLSAAACRSNSHLNLSIRKTA